MLLAAIALPFLAPRDAASVAAAASPQHTPDAILVSATIERPSMAPLLITRPAESVVVSSGDTLDSLAAAHHSDAAAIRWANNLSGGAQPQPGATLLIPPSDGALVQVREGERPSDFAQRLGLDARVVLDYNSLSSDAPLPAGSWLQVPTGSAPRGALVGRYFEPAAPGVPAVPANHGSDTFPYGQCTYYVASRRDVSWGGNAGTWFSHADGIRPEGHTPVQGAILVEGIGWVGHVAYVEHVNADGSFVVSEMNYGGGDGGWGRVDQRTIAADDPGIIGFIY